MSLAATQPGLQLTRRSSSPRQSRFDLTEPGQPIPNSRIRRMAADRQVEQTVIDAVMTPVVADVTDTEALPTEMAPRRPAVVAAGARPNDGWGRSVASIGFRLAGAVVILDAHREAVRVEGFTAPETNAEAARSLDVLRCLLDGLCRRAAKPRPGTTGYLAMRAVPSAEHRTGPRGLGCRRPPGAG